MSKFDFVNSLKHKQSNIVRKENIFLEDQHLHIQKQIKNSYIDIFCGDVKDYINLLKDNSIHLVVTSPPYNCNIKYDVYNDNKDIKEYQEWLIDVFRKTYFKMVSGGRIAVNFPMIIKHNNKRILILNLYEKILTNAGFEIIDCITWIKSKSEKEAVGVAGRSTAWGSWLSPTSPNIRPITEFILIAKKQGKYKKQSFSDISIDEFKLFTISAWFIPSQNDKIHPATFPVELPKRLIKLFTYKHENVFDPFMGVGNTAIAAVETNRNFYGCDISNIYINESIKKLENFYKNVQCQQNIRNLFV